MKVVILAGGLGSRLAEETEVKPKPMVAIGGRPILWHIMKHYSRYGFEEFVLALGYKGEYIKRYFMDLVDLNGSMTLSMQDGKIHHHDSHPESWVIHMVDTGLQTQTGGRLKRLARRLGNEPFMMTYGDGVSNLDLQRLLEFHRSHGKLATVTAVRPPARFGGLELDGSRVSHFAEKSQIAEGWINGGFFVLEPGVLEYIEGDATDIARAPMEHLARDGELMAYCHEGFWQCMDTLRDVLYLESLWSSGKAPWAVWDHQEV
jgi:glucose-1-phosphate cytidylyltransferase